MPWPLLLALGRPCSGSSPGFWAAALNFFSWSGQGTWGGPPAPKAYGRSTRLRVENTQVSGFFFCILEAHHTLSSSPSPSPPCLVLLCCHPRMRQWPCLLPGPVPCPQPLAGASQMSATCSSHMICFSTVLRMLSQVSSKAGLLRASHLYYLSTLNIIII